MKGVLVLLSFLFVISCVEKEVSELDSYLLPAHTKLEIVASEPLLDTPVAIDFDEHGRIWVLEMKAYMPNIEGQGELAPINTIKILEDQDGDGLMDTAKIFMDSLVLPRTILLAYGGLLYAEPPNLWFVEIEGDQPGPRTLVDSLYISDGNVEHQPNALTLNLDNWIYSANSNARYKLVNDQWLKEFTTPRGQWGLTKDNFGRLLYNNNGLLLATDQTIPNTLFNNEYVKFKENNHQVITENQRVFPLQATAVNRGYQDGVLNPEGKLINTTSACAPFYYPNQNLEGWTENVFVALPEINAVKKLTIIRNGLTTHAKQVDTTREYLIALDEGFRPVNISLGPDGNIYIVDMHRGIIQHKAYMTSYLRDLILKRQLDEVRGMGRILKLSHKDNGHSSLDFDVSKDPLKHLFSEHAFFRDKAQQHIVQHKLTRLIPELEEKCEYPENEVHLLHVLWTLEGLDALRDTMVINLIDTEFSHLRIHALELVSRVENIDKARVKGALLKLLQANEEERDYAFICYANRLNIFSNEELFAYYKTILNRRNHNPKFIEALNSDIAGKEDFFLQLLTGENIKDFTSWKEGLEEIVRRQEENRPVHYYRNDLNLEDGRTIGMRLYVENCGPCHGMDGEGKPQIAPELLDSEYVSGSDEQLILITLHGMTGPFQMKGETHHYNAGMPGIAFNDDLSDRDIKEILHFVRNAFASAPYSITEEEIRKLRKYKPEKTAFTAASLDSILKVIDTIDN